MIAAARKAALGLLESHRRAGLDMLILFVTSRCNAKCDTCFYHLRLNDGRDLSGEELARFAASLPPFRDLWLSGGEPLLRPDLDRVVGEFVERCFVRTVDLPINGLFPAAAAAFAREFARRHQETSLYINVALDGLGADHDRVRGVPGNFEKTEQTLLELAALRGDCPRLRVHVNTVVCVANLGQIEAIGEHVWSRHRADGHFFQVIRGAAKDPALLEVPLSELERIHRYALGVHRRYADRLFGDRGRFERWLKTSAYMGTFLTHYETQRAVIAGATPWAFPCVAADRALVVEHDGTVRACELRSQLANLRDFDMDYRRLLASGLLQEEARDIAEHPCPCTHVCFLHTSLKQSPKHLALLPVLGMVANRAGNLSR